MGYVVVIGNLIRYLINNKKWILIESSEKWRDKYVDNRDYVIIEIIGFIFGV